MTNQTPAPATLYDKSYYFLASMSSATIKTIWYAFTTPSAMRKALEHSNEAEIHKSYLENKVDEENKDPILKKYINWGDKIGFGLIPPVIIGYFGLKAPENQEFWKIWMLSNAMSLGYETLRYFNKPQEK